MLFWIDFNQDKSFSKEEDAERYKKRPLRKKILTETNWKSDLRI